MDDFGRSVWSDNSHPTGVLDRPTSHNGCAIKPQKTNKKKKLGALSPLRRFGQDPSCSPHHLPSAMPKEKSAHD